MPASARPACITSRLRQALGAASSIVHDVNGAHNSYIVTPQINYGTPLSRKADGRHLRVGAIYVGKRYADTYFGVDAAGALPAACRSTTRGSGLEELYASARSAPYALTGDLLARLQLGRRRAPIRACSTISRDSPMVRDRRQSRTSGSARSGSPTPSDLRSAFRVSRSIRRSCAASRQAACLQSSDVSERARTPCVDRARSAARQQRSTTRRREDRRHDRTASS